MMLYKLLSRLDRSRIDSNVITLTTSGPVGERIRGLGYEVSEIGMARGRLNPVALLRLARRLRGQRPDVLQTWMTHSDLAGGLAARLAHNIPVVWNIQHSNFDPAATNRLTLWAVRACALLSSTLPSAIVSCSHEGLRVHAELGYRREKMLVIPNGFDTDSFHSDQQARDSVRRELGLADDQFLVGAVSRFHPQKDHACFIKAAAIVCQTMPRTRFVLCGDGISWSNPELASWLGAANLRDSVFLLGRRTDTPAIMAALDIFVSSSSFGEGFPNVVGEAMSCAVPCVVTQVGDSAIAVGETGRVVPPRDPAALAHEIAALLKASAIERLNLGQAARRRIIDNFGLDAIVTQYANLYMKLAGRSAPIQPPRS